ncbi:hypothetical protein [Porphyromonas sp.]
MKHLLKCLLLPLAVAALCSACRSEAPTTDATAVTKPTRKRQTIKLRLSADLTLPIDQRATDFGSLIDIDMDNPKRASVNFKDSELQVKVYLRKKGSTNPKDIFSILVNGWGKTELRNGHLYLWGGTETEEDVDADGRPTTITTPFDKDVYVNEIEMEHHPDRYGAGGEKNLPRGGESWEAAAIIYGEGDQDKRDTAPMNLIDLDDTENAPFTEDAIWLVKPRTLFVAYLNREAYKDQDVNFRLFDIPYCADWRPVSVSGDGSVSISLKAKPAGTILHYVLNSRVEPTLEAPATASASSAARAVRAGHRQSFRGGSNEGYDPTGYVDNLSTGLGTFYGALYYNQDGNKVHWRRGKWIATYHGQDGATVDYNRIPAQFRQGPRAEDMKLALHPEDYVDPENHYKPSHWMHIFYFLMPPYDGGSTGGGTTTNPKFWMTDKIRKDKRDLDALRNTPDEATYNYGFNDDTRVKYHLMKYKGKWVDEYVTPLSALVPGKIHSVYLYWQLDPPPTSH